MSLFAALFTAAACLLALVVPWIGVLAYYLFSAGQMQPMWPHDFGDARVSLLLTASTLLGLCGATAIKHVNYRVLFYPPAILMLVLCIWVNLSISFSDYVVHYDNVPGQLTQAEIIETFNKIIVFFFIAILLIDTRKKLEGLVYLLALILVYFTYWANKAYLTGEFWLFGDNGRLGGPPQSLYFDENYLAMLYVLATPVLYYIGVVRKYLVVRYAIWLIIPLSWHALFLTGSRGGLVSLGVVCIYVFFRSYNKKASIGIIVGLIVATIYQSGFLLTRVDETINDANQVESTIVSEAEALDPRLVSWLVGMKMIRDHPGFGVGAGNFILAFPDYSNTDKHVAHNTFLQFAAETGLVAGLIYLWLFGMRILQVFKRSPPDAVYQGGLPRDYLDDLINSVYLGFFVVAVFLDLMIHELLYITLVIGVAKYAIDRQVEPAARQPKSSIYRIDQIDQSKRKPNTNQPYTG